jgi:type IV pilus assembly protein PilA
MKLNRSKKGFTLVEIMIVVVIIGLLAAMAIPAFQKVRKNAVGKTVLNDARQIAGACQQLILEKPGASGVVTFNYTSATGAIDNTAAGGLVVGDLAQYVQKITKGLTLSATYDGTVAAGAEAFTITHTQLVPADVGGTTAGTAISFDTEGKVR